MFVTFDPDHIRKAAAFVEALADLEERFGYRLALSHSTPDGLGIKTSAATEDEIPQPLAAVRGPGGRFCLGVRRTDPAPGVGQVAADGDETTLRGGLAERRALLGRLLRFQLDDGPIEDDDAARAWLRELEA